MTIKEVTALQYNLIPQNINNAGVLICKEGVKANHLVIIKSGVFEISRSKLNNILINEKSGLIQLPAGIPIDLNKESPKDVDAEPEVKFAGSTNLKSNCLLRNTEIVEEKPQRTQKGQIYQGSYLQRKV